MANEEYEHFIPLYIYFSLRSNKNSKVEIGIENPELYRKNNEEKLEILRRTFGDRFHFKQVDFDGVLPGAVRFVTEPDLVQECDYVYIGDIDILIFDQNIEEKHVKNMNKHGEKFSNIIRDDENSGGNMKLSGLHFSPMDVQYPLPDIADLDFSLGNPVPGADENILYKIMNKQTKMISEEMAYRPVHGIHVRTKHHPFGRRVDGAAPEFSFEEIIQGEQVITWSGIECEKYRNEFLKVTQEEEFQRLYFKLDIRAKNILNILENVCRERFGKYEQEAYTYIIGESIARKNIRKFMEYVDNNGIIWTFQNKIKNRVFDQSQQ